MYYLTIVQNDSTQAVYSYQDIDSALASFHSELAYRGDGRNKTLCVIIDDKGELIKTELWERKLTS